MQLRYTLGQYKLMIKFENTNILVGVSEMFEVVPLRNSSAVVTTKQHKYELGHYMMIRWNKVINQNEYFWIIPNNHTSDDVNSTKYYEGYTLYYETTNIPFNAALGKFKVVMFFENTDILLTVSEMFEVITPNSSSAVVTTNQRLYKLGDQMAIEWKKTNGQVINNNNVIRIIPNNVTSDYVISRTYYSTYTGFTSAGFTDSVTIQFKAALGQFRVVMFLERTDI
jgi:hypothetical protein